MPDITNPIDGLEKMAILADALSRCDGCGKAPNGPNDPVVLCIECYDKNRPSYALVAAIALIYARAHPAGGEADLALRVLAGDLEKLHAELLSHPRPAERQHGGRR